MCLLIVLRSRNRYVYEVIICRYDMHRYLVKAQLVFAVYNMEYEEEEYTRSIFENFFTLIYTIVIILIIVYYKITQLK